VAFWLKPDVRLDAGELGEPVATHGSPEFDEAFFLVRVLAVPSARRRSGRVGRDPLDGVPVVELGRDPGDARDRVPEGLADLLDALATTGPPASPWRLPWESVVQS
jgi:hypothetical protein